MSKILDIFKKKDKSINKEALAKERESLVNRLNAITMETSLEDLLSLHKDWHQFRKKLKEIAGKKNGLDDFSHPIIKEFELYLNSEQRKIFNTVINKQSDKFRSGRHCSPNTKYNDEYGLWERVPKGQKPVDADKLNEKKRCYAEWKAKPENQLENIRKRQFEDIIHWNGGKCTMYGWSGFYHWLYDFCTRCDEWYHHIAVQAMRDMYKMLPKTFDISYLKFDNIDDDTLVLIKHSNKRKDYRDEKQWKEIIDFIRDHNTSKLIKKVFFCVYIDKRFSKDVKIRDKEYKFIENAGCSEVGDVQTDMWIDNPYEHNKSSKDYNSYHRILKGKLFKINY